MFSLSVIIICVLLHSIFYSFALPLPNFKSATTTTPPPGLPRDVKDILGNPLKFSFKRAKLYLKAYKYLGPDSPDPVMRNLSITDPDKAVKIALGDFQKFANLKVTNKLDNDTNRMMRWPRCAMEDRTAANKTMRIRVKRFSTVGRGYRWLKTRLTYRMKKFPKNEFILSLSEERRVSAPNKTDIRSAIRRAFKLWSAASKLRFKPVKRNADINLMFVERKHGDPYPFDGPNGRIAHAFYPTWGGDVHFDSHEAWTVNKGGVYGYDLFQVTVHELGHSLGLHHVSNRNSIMYPFYKYRTNFKLSNDDKAGIRYLY